MPLAQLLENFAIYGAPTLLIEIPDDRRAHRVEGSRLRGTARFDADEVQTVTG